MHETPHGSILRRAGPLLVARLGVAALTFAIPMVLARMLVPAGYGTFKQAWLLSNTLFLVLPLGLWFGWLRQRTDSLLPSLAAHIANQYQGAASFLQASSLFYLGVILLVMSLVANFAAQLIVRRYAVQRAH